MFRDVCNLIIKPHRNHVLIYRSDSKWAVLRQLMVLKSGYWFDWSTKVAMLIGRLSVKPWCYWLWKLIDELQLALTLKMTIAQVVETSVTVKDSLQDYSHLDNHASPSYLWNDC